MYPKGVPERAYQLSCIQTALLHNTLVCLPTGLGKTLIAAVVMHNFTRWFPKAGGGQGLEGQGGGRGGWHSKGK